MGGATDPGILDPNTPDSDAQRHQPVVNKMAQVFLLGAMWACGQLPHS